MSKTEEEINAEKASRSRPDLVPTRSHMAGGRAFAVGVAKHGLGKTGRGTYRDAGTEQSEVETHRASFFRHWCAFWSGQSNDPDSGLSHLDHMVAQLAIIVDLVEDPPNLPDRRASGEGCDGSGSIPDPEGGTPYDCPRIGCHPAAFGGSGVGCP